MTDDIVARLRLYAQKQRETKSSVLGLLLSDAADEIERLRVIVQGWELSERDSTALLAMLSKPDHPNAALRQAAKRHKQITSEGDMLSADGPASRRTPMVDIEICKFLLDEVDRLRAERDEARVDACRLESEARSRFARMSGMSCYYVSPKQIAKERDWNCFDSVPAYIKAHEVRGDVAGPEGAD